MEEKLRILLCEDDESLGMLLREYLQAKGYEAELFPDGDAGYKAFLKNRYEMCVLDVRERTQSFFSFQSVRKMISRESSTCSKCRHISTMMRRVMISPFAISQRI